MENKEIETIGLKVILVTYLRRWRFFLGVFIFSFIPAILYLHFYPRTYEIAASVMLQEKKEAGMTSLGVGSTASLMKSFGIGAFGGNAMIVDDAKEMLASNRLQRLMVQELGINITYTEPFSFYKMYHEAPLVLSADSETLANLQDEIRLNISVKPGSILVNVKTKLSKWKGDFTFSSLPATFEVETAVFTLNYAPYYTENKSFKLKIKCIPASWAAESVNKKLAIEDVSNSSNVLTLYFSDHSRQRGVDILNTLVQKYNDDMDDYQQVEDMKTMTIVNKRIETVLSNLSQVEDNLKDFKKMNDITLLEADVSLYSESFKEIQTALIENTIIAHKIDLIYDFIKDPENKNKAIPPVFMVDASEKGVLEPYNKAVVHLEQLLLNVNENNTTYKRLELEVELLRESVHTMIENARKNVAKTLVDLKNKEKDLTSKFKSVHDKEREYAAFVRDQEILQGIYLLMLQKKEEVNLSLNKQTDTARLIEPAYIKKKPLGPRKLYAGLGILVLTLFVPVVYFISKDLVKSLVDEFKR